MTIRVCDRCGGLDARDQSLCPACGWPYAWDSGKVERVPRPEGEKDLPCRKKRKPLLFPRS